MSGAVDVYLGLGSNQGNRRENIDSALSMLDSNEKIHVDKVSDIIETEPWGFAAEQNFLNCVARGAGRENIDSGGNAGRVQRH